MEMIKILFERDTDGSSSFVNFDEDTLKLSSVTALTDFGEIEYVVVRALKSLNADIDIDDTKFHTWGDEYFFYPKNNSCLRNNNWPMEVVNIEEQLYETYKACLDLVQTIVNPVVWYRSVWSDVHHGLGYKYRTNAGGCNPEIQYYSDSMDDLFSECNARFGEGGFSVKALDSGDENWRCELITDFYKQNPGFFASNTSIDFER